jgi:hypothetical protein
MSAAVLRNPRRVQSIEDDRESAVHVLTLLALCYSNHDEFDNLASYLAVYNQVDHRLSKDIVTGGLHKGGQFASAMFPTFTSDPLNRLLTQVRESFSFRYANKKYSNEEVREVKEYVAGGKYDPIYGYPPSYIYGSHMEAIKKPNWLVEVFNNYLELDNWPSYDKAVANNLISSTSTQGKLEDRVSGSSSKRRH